MFPVVGVADAVASVQAVKALQPANTGGVQPVADCEVIRRRHLLGENVPPVRHGCHAREERIPDVAEEVETGHGDQRVAGLIDGRRRRLSVGVAPSGRVPENSLTRQIGKHDGVGGLLRQVTLVVDQHEKESLILDNRTAQTPSVLVLVHVRFLRALLIVEPVVRIQDRVVVRHEQGPVVLVGSRPGLQPHLRGTVRRLRIGGGRHNLHLFHQVGTHIRGILTLKVVTDAVTRVVDHYAIPVEVHRTDSLAREASFRASACRRRDQLKNVTEGHRQGFDFDFG